MGNWNKVNVQSIVSVHGLWKCLKRNKLDAWFWRKYCVLVWLDLTSEARPGLSAFLKFKFKEQLLQHQPALDSRCPWAPGSQVFLRRKQEPEQISDPLAGDVQGLRRGRGTQSPLRRVQTSEVCYISKSESEGHHSPVIPQRQGSSGARSLGNWEQVRGGVEKSGSNTQTQGGQSCWERSEVGKGSLCRRNLGH